MTHYLLSVYMLAAKSVFGYLVKPTFVPYYIQYMSLVTHFTGKFGHLPNEIARSWQAHMSLHTSQAEVLQFYLWCMLGFTYVVLCNSVVVLCSSETDRVQLTGPNCSETEKESTLERVIVAELLRQLS